MSAEVQIRALNAEIASLKELILQMTTDHEREVSSLTHELQRLRFTGSLSGSPTKKEEALTEELHELRNSRAEDRARFSSDSQKEVSVLRFEIAALKNVIASKEAHNAELTLRNIELSQRLHATEETLEETQRGIGDCQKICTARISTVYSESRRHQHKILKGLASVMNQLSRLASSMTNAGEKVGQLWAEVRKHEFLLHGNERAIEYLLNSLSLMADTPMDRPVDVKRLMADPEEIIALVDTTASECSRERVDLRERLRATSRSLAESLAVLRRPPLSEPVARVLTNLGSVILDVHSQMEEEHADTLRLLTSFRSDDDMSDNFDDDGL
jgi:chromosome segregation ATPase